MAAVVELKNNTVDLDRTQVRKKKNIVGMIFDHFLNDE